VISDAGQHDLGDAVDECFTVELLQLVDTSTTSTGPFWRTLFSCVPVGIAERIRPAALPSWDP
jgi:hypothetical protein